MFFCLLLAPAGNAGDVTINVDGSTGVKPLVEALAAEFQKAESTQEIAFRFGNGLNPTDRISALVQGRIDIAMASHGIDVKQIHSLGLTTHRFARMAVVFGVNHLVPVGNLTHQQLCDIYNAKLLEWNQTLKQEKYDSPLKIRAFIRPFEEVDTEVVNQHIPCFGALTIAEQIKLMPKSGDMAKALANTVGAIGMTTQVRVAQSNGLIRAIAINGIFPSSKNLLTNKYPLSRDSYLITTASPSENVRKFIEFIYSDTGTQVIMTNNAVPASK